MKKQLNEDQVTNELRSGSLFFARREGRPTSPQQTPVPENVTLSPNHQATLPPKGQGAKETNHQVTMSPSHQSHLPSTSSPGVERALSEREYFRCSIQEVEAIEELKTRLRRDQGIHTSKQDIERLAVKRVVEEYDEFGEKSQLVASLRKLGKR